MRKRKANKQLKSGSAKKAKQVAVRSHEFPLHYKDLGIQITVSATVLVSFLHLDVIPTVLEYLSGNGLKNYHTLYQIVNNAGWRLAIDNFFRNNLQNEMPTLVNIFNKLEDHLTTFNGCLKTSGERLLVRYEARDKDKEEKTPLFDQTHFNPAANPLLQTLSQSSLFPLPEIIPQLLRTFFSTEGVTFLLKPGSLQDQIFEVLNWSILKLCFAYPQKVDQYLDYFYYQFYQVFISAPQLKQFYAGAYATVAATSLALKPAQGGAIGFNLLEPTKKNDSSPYLDIDWRAFATPATAINFIDVRIPAAETKHPFYLDYWRHIAYSPSLFQDVIGIGRSFYYTSLFNSFNKGVTRLTDAFPAEFLQKCSLLFMQMYQNLLHLKKNHKLIKFFMEKTMAALDECEGAVSFGWTANAARQLLEDEKQMKKLKPKAQEALNEIREFLRPMLKKLVSASSPSSTVSSMAFLPPPSSSSSSSSCSSSSSSSSCSSSSSSFSSLSSSSFAGRAVFLPPPLPLPPPAEEREVISGLYFD